MRQGSILKNRNFFGNTASFDHFGYCVGSISDFDDELSTTVDNTQKVKVGFFQMNGVKVELVETPVRALASNENAGKRAEHLSRVLQGGRH